MNFAKQVEADLQLSFLPKLYEFFPGSEWFLVGGSVRDFLMGRGEKKDFDLIARKISLQALQEALEKMGKVTLVGRNFGVLKFTPAGSEEVIDIAWPRTERAGGSGGYRDFEVQSDPELPVEEDLARRDFTMNAVAWDLRHQRFIDPFSGRSDIERKVIKAVGDPGERFSEDYSRMLRGLRFACQLGFRIEAGTWEALKRLVAHLDDARHHPERPGETEFVVPRETIAKEMIKAAAADPLKCLDLYEKSGALFKLMPELVQLGRTEQSPDHHSEGDVWTHTKLAVSKLESPEFAVLFPGERPSAELFFAVLLHDVAKPMTAGKKGDSTTFYGHDAQGAPIARRVAERLHLASYDKGGVSAERLEWLVRMHLFPHHVSPKEAKRTTLARHFLSDPVAGRELLQLAFVDTAASLPERGQPDFSNLKELMATLGEIAAHTAGRGEQPAKLASGEDVMRLLGLDPGPQVGRVIESLREAQLRGEVNTREEAVEFLKNAK